MNKQLDALVCDGSIFCLKIESSDHQNHCLGTDKVFEVYHKLDHPKQTTPVKGYLWSGAGKPIELTAFRLLTCIAQDANSPRAYKDGVNTIFVCTAERDGVPMITSESLVPIMNSQVKVLTADFKYPRGNHPLRIKNFTLSSKEFKRAEYTGPEAIERSLDAYLNAIQDCNAELLVELYKDPQLGYALKYSVVQW